MAKDQFPPSQELQESEVDNDSVEALFTRRAVGGIFLGSLANMILPNMAIAQAPPATTKAEPMTPYEISLMRDNRHLIYRSFTNPTLYRQLAMEKYFAKGMGEKVKQGLKFIIENPMDVYYKHSSYGVEVGPASKKAHQADMPILTFYQGEGQKDRLAYVGSKKLDDLLWHPGEQFSSLCNRMWSNYVKNRKQKLSKSSREIYAEVNYEFPHLLGELIEARKAVHPYETMHPRYSKFKELLAEHPRQWGEKPRVWPLPKKGDNFQIQEINDKAYFIGPDNKKIRIKNVGELAIKDGKKGTYTVNPHGKTEQVAVNYNVKTKTYTIWKLNPKNGKPSEIIVGFTENLEMLVPSDEDNLFNAPWNTVSNYKREIVEFAESKQTVDK